MKNRKEEGMEEIVDARGLACPQPVILAKKALEQHTRIVVYVDNAAAMENIRRLGAHLKCAVTIDKMEGNIYHIHLSRGPGDLALPEASDEAFAQETCQSARSGPLVVAIASETMGRGNDELGGILIKAFIHTLLQIDALPERIIFYNTGVKLTAQGSDVLDDLRRLADAGVEILVCGTCVNYFGLSGLIGVGTVSNMFEIAGTMAAAGRLITP
jgi:selenium metabolism protein YedF